MTPTNRFYLGVAALMVVLVVCLSALAAYSMNFRFDEEKEEMRRKLAVTCALLDEFGYAGDPQVCLDADGEPFNQ